MRRRLVARGALEPPHLFSPSLHANGHLMQSAEQHRRLACPRAMHDPGVLILEGKASIEKYLSEEHMSEDMKTTESDATFAQLGLRSSRVQESNFFQIAYSNTVHE